jgi:hypothetical protein
MRADIPPAVEALTLKMLSRRLDQRFKSCAEIVRAIDVIPGIDARAADIGAFVAGRFPDEAAAGAAEAARCARRRGRVLVARDIAEGTVGVDPAEEDDLATAILSPALREQLLASARAPLPPTGPLTTLPKPPAARPALDEDIDDAATVRVTPEVVAQLRGGGTPPRPPTIGTLSPDEDEIATSRVSPELAQAARDIVLGSTSPPPPLAPSPARVPPASSTTSSSVPAVPRLPSSMTSSSTQRPALVTSPLSMAPAVPTAALAPTPAMPARPATASATVRAVAPPPAPPAPTSWVAVAAATFGALALVIGIVFSLARPSPVPTFITFQDPATGQSIIVGDQAHVPVGRESKVLDLDAATLHTAGDLDGQPVARADLEARLRASGVWDRATLPTSAKARTAALLPVLVSAMGLLVLALALPVIVVRGRRVLAQVALAAVAIAIAAGVLQFGGLSWPGRAAFDEAPRLAWE